MLKTSFGGWSAPTPVMLYRMEISWSWSERICDTTSKQNNSQLTTLVRQNNETQHLFWRDCIWAILWAAYYSKGSLWSTASKFNHSVLALWSWQADIAIFSQEVLAEKKPKKIPDTECAHCYVDVHTHLSSTGISSYRTLKDSIRAAAGIGLLAAQKLIQCFEEKEEENHHIFTV